MRECWSGFDLNQAPGVMWLLVAPMVGPLGVKHSLWSLCPSVEGDICSNVVSDLTTKIGSSKSIYTMIADYFRRSFLPLLDGATVKAIENMKKRIKCHELALH